MKIPGQGTHSDTADTNKVDMVFFLIHAPVRSALPPDGGGQSRLGLPRTVKVACGGVDNSCDSTDEAVSGSGGGGGSGGCPGVGGGGGRGGGGGFRSIANAGQDGVQEVPHFHMHIVPRWAGDTNFMAVFGDVRVIPKTLKALWQEMRNAAAEMHLPELDA